MPRLNDHMLPAGLITAVQVEHESNELKKNEEVDFFNIYLVQNAYLIWDPDVVRKIQSKFGIFGTLVGILPRKIRQNRMFGLPLQIFKEEAFLLRMTGLASIVELQQLPCINDVEKFDRCLMKSFSQQNEYLLKSIFNKSQEFVDKPLEKPHHLDLTGGIDLKNPPKHLQRVFQRQLSEFWTSSYNVYNEIVLTDLERLRLAVLQDLYKRKYMATAGDKFGADFLVYPGNPLVYHAYFVVKVCCSLSDISSTELLTFSRLASSVRKVAVIASVNGAKVTYISLQWSGLK